MEHKQSRRLLQCIDDNILTQMVENCTRRGALLDLVPMNKEDLVRDVKAGGSLNCSDHEMVKFRTMQGSNEILSRIAALNFRRDSSEETSEILEEYPRI